MEDRVVTVICYSNGKIVNGPQGVSYDRPPVAYIRVRMGISRDELETMICNALKIDHHKAKLNIIYRYPMLLGGGMVNYIPLPIEDEQNIRDIFGIISEFPPPNTMELILEAITEESEPQQRQHSPFVHANVVGPSTEPPTEDAHNRSPGSALSPSEYNASGDEIDIGNCEDSDDEHNYNSDNNEKDNDNANDKVSKELRHDVVRDAVARVILGEGFAHTPPLQEDGGNIDLQDRELDGMDTAPQGNAPGYSVPSPIFVELNNKATEAIPEDSSMPHFGTWSESHELHKGLRFDTKQDLQYAVKRYSIRKHYEYTVVDSEPDVWAVKCKKCQEGCKWRLRACKRKRNQLFEITKYIGPHTCSLSRPSKDHSQLDSLLISREIHSVVQQDPSTSIATLHQIVKDKFGYEVHYKKVWDAKKKAIASIFGDWDASYKMLPKWMAVLEQKNPGTQVVWDYHPLNDGTAVFKRVFWSFGPSIEGFKHCRPIIQIDGTFLCGKYHGKLLVANSIDANSHIFPLAFALVEEESADIWCWFLRCLRQRVSSREGICIISDIHEDILFALTSSDNGWAEPRAHHRYCLKHVCSSFDNKYKNKELKDLAYRAGIQHQPRKFEACMKELTRLKGNCVDFFNDIARERWTMAYDNGVRYGWMTTNLVECIDGVLKGARFYPVTTLVQLTFFRCMAYFTNRQAEISSAFGNGNVFTEYAIEKMKKWAMKASGHSIKLVNHQNESFEVMTGRHGLHMDKGGNKQVVILKERHCSCNKWQCFGIPCSHLQAVCAHLQIDCEQFIEHYYRLDVYARCYQSEFNPIPPEDCWPPSTLPSLLPNEHLKRKSGRPKSTCIRNDMDLREQSQKIRCGLCKQEGHNRRNCPNKGQA